VQHTKLCCTIDCERRFKQTPKDYLRRKRRRSASINPLPAKTANALEAAAGEISGTLIPGGAANKSGAQLTKARTNVASRMP